MTLKGGKIVLLHTLPKCSRSAEQHFGDKIIARNFVFFVATSFPLPHFERYLFLKLSEISGVHIKSQKFIKIERCHKIGRPTDFSSHNTFVIVIDNFPLALGYDLRRSLRWEIVIRIKFFSSFPLFSYQSPLRCSFLQMFYAANLRHMCLVPTLFKVFPSSDQFVREKSGCCHSKISKFCHCNRKCDNSIVLNHYSLEHITSNNNI